MKPSVKAALFMTVATIFANHASADELRFVEKPNFVLDGNTPSFQVRLICKEPFEVQSYIVTPRDPSSRVRVKFYKAMQLANPFSGGLTPPYGWNIAHQDFSLFALRASNGAELLSNMNIPQLAMAGTSFDLFGTRSPNTHQTTLTLGAVVKTKEKPGNKCGFTVIDH